MKLKSLAILFTVLCFSVQLYAQDTVYINMTEPSSKIAKRTFDYSQFTNRFNVFMGFGVATGIGDASNYRFSDFKHETEVGPTFDIGLSYQHGFDNGFHLEVSAMFSYHDFYEDQMYTDSKENKSYLINGNVEYFAGRLTFSVGKEYKLSDNWIYSFSAGPIIEIKDNYTFATYSMIDNENPANSVFNRRVYSSNSNEAGFNDPIKLSIQNKIYLVGKRRGGGLFFNLQTLYLGKGKFPLPFDHPGFWGISNTMHIGYSLRF